MLAVLLIAGIALLSVGLVTLGFGIPVKEFAFGSTLILSGTVTGCTGLVLLALWIMVRELKTMVALFSAGFRAENFAGELDDDPAPEDRQISFGRTPLATAPGKEPAGQSSALPPWQDEPAPRDRGRLMTPAGEPEPVAKPRRDLMFSASPRKERGQARGSEGSAGPAAALDDSGPRERPRLSDPPSRRGLRPPLRSSDPGAAEAPDYAPVAARTDDRKAVTLLKSGVVDGMAYSLYSDGSIEAQMPEGMMRFASIDELRSHLDQRP
jgi:hypothetical protein